MEHLNIIQYLEFPLRLVPGSAVFYAMPTTQYKAGVSQLKGSAIDQIRISTPGCLSAPPSKDKNYM
jgi:hypothetical protein